MIPEYPVNADVEIGEQGTWPATVHRFDARSVAALRASEACGRPLLIRGAPGVGKSQTARAAAAFAKRAFLSFVVDGRTEPHDLIWRFDSLRRLADAQTLQAGERLPSEGEYLEPQALWWAYDWEDAAKHAKAAAPSIPAGWSCGSNRSVLLIDEIDKADPDLPNALLEVLANRGFHVPYTGKFVACESSSRSLVIVTTNEERELPAPFLRRCLVLTLDLPTERTQLCAYLESLGESHQKSGSSGARGKCVILGQVAERLADAREVAAQSGEYIPSTAEYLDLVNALANLCPDDEEAQLDALALLQEFTLRKSFSSHI